MRKKGEAGIFSRTFWFLSDPSKAGVSPLQLDLSTVQQKHAGIGDTVQQERTKKNSLLLQR